MNRKKNLFTIVATLLAILIFKFVIIGSVTKEKIRFDNGEVIYLYNFKRGLNEDFNVISKSSFVIYANLGEDLLDNNGSPFFYKKENNKLRIYGGRWEGEIELDKVNVEIRELTNSEYLNINFEDSLDIFPEYKKKVLLND